LLITKYIKNCALLGAARIFIRLLTRFLPGQWGEGQAKGWRRAEPDVNIIKPNAGFVNSQASLKFLHQQKSNIILYAI
jgi:hypothetical protein